MFYSSSLLLRDSVLGFKNQEKNQYQLHQCIIKETVSFVIGNNFNYESNDFITLSKAFNP